VDAAFAVSVNVLHSIGPVRWSIRTQPRLASDLRAQANQWLSECGAGDGQVNLFAMHTSCGKRFSPTKVRERNGWQDVPAVRDGQLHEIKSALILQPGPAALLEGLPALHKIIAAAAG